MPPLLLGDIIQINRLSARLGWFALVYCLITPQQQSGSYRGGDCDDEMSRLLLEETGASRGNHRPTQVTQTCPVPVPNPGYSGVMPGDLRHQESNLTGIDLDPTVD